MWELYEVPDEVRAKLLLPLLTTKAKTLISRLSVTDLEKVEEIKKILVA